MVAAATLLLVTFLLRPTPPAADARQPPPPQPAEVLDFRIRLLTRDAVILIVTGSVLAMAAGVWLSRRMTRPLEQLADGAATIGAGELSFRVTPTGSAELRELAFSFNQMAADLEASERLRRNLFADVAHELRTPLTVIQGNLRALLDDVYPLDKAEVARLYEQTRHLSRLVSDLHELALAEARQLPLHKEWVDANAWVSDAVEIFAPLAEEQEVAVTMALPATSPQVWADQARLTQVLHNLLGNALHHTTTGGQIRLQLTQQDESIRLEVADTGEGIAPEHLAHIFDRFYRADPARDRDTGGAGLGLALVRAMVEAHGGQVAAASAGIGYGSVFTVTLPLNSAETKQ